MADHALRGTPGPVLTRAFEITAATLRALGSRRRLIGDGVGALAYALQPPRRRRLSAHLHSRAAGGLPPAEARRRARASYRSYARMVVDSLWVHAVPVDEMFHHGRIEGVERLDDARDAGRGAIIALVHFGSWDIAASLALAAGHPVTSVMAPVGARWVTELLAWSRRVKDMELFSPAAAARGLLRALRRGRLVALLIDIPEGGPTTTVRYCNGPVQFSTGPAVLARLSGAPLIPAECWRTETGYVVHLHPPYTPAIDDDHQAIMQRLATILEAKVHRLPEQWYPFNQIYQDEM
ncbi:MAG: lysophospholipid acyltransferase family protein [Candidatus Dormibacteraeota bacterium]|uniref:Lysophospholipid acyltransferase family protein n=1 Tax=Candidatus Amunia macphersoniae TaxID=3127014 RepID=A0A934KNF2_9BACT|nr:lysophospholipid acyltransferase family protein [Candidatus Dormibacteraeota bacterium]